jgi:hypothetical protein
MKRFSIILPANGFAWFVSRAPDDGWDDDDLHDLRNVLGANFEAAVQKVFSRRGALNEGQQHNRWWKV